MKAKAVDSYKVNTIKQSCFGHPNAEQVNECPVVSADI